MQSYTEYLLLRRCTHKLKNCYHKLIFIRWPPETWLLAKECATEVLQDYLGLKHSMHPIWLFIEVQKPYAVAKCINLCLLVGSIYASENAAIITLWWPWVHAWHLPVAIQFLMLFFSCLFASKSANNANLNICFWAFLRYLTHAEISGAPAVKLLCKLKICITDEIWILHVRGFKKEKMPVT